MEDLKILTESVCCIAREAGYFLKEEMDKRKEPGFNYVFHRIVLKKRQQSNTLHRLVCYNGETSPASFKNNGCSGPLVAMI